MPTGDTTLKKRHMWPPPFTALVCWKLPLFSLILFFLFVHHPHNLMIYQPFTWISKHCHVVKPKFVYSPFTTSKIWSHVVIYTFNIARLTRSLRRTTSVALVHNVYNCTAVHSSGQVISPSQRPLPAQDKETQETNIRALRGIRNRDSSNQAAADLRLRPRGYRGRLQRH
jgi:hypothetical protein